MFDIGDCAPPQPTMIRSGKQDLVCTLEIFELYIVVDLCGNTVGITLNQRVQGPNPAVPIEPERASAISRRLPLTAPCPGIGGARCPPRDRPGSRRSGLPGDRGFPPCAAGSWSRSRAPWPRPILSGTQPPATGAPASGHGGFVGRGETRDTRAGELGAQGGHPPPPPPAPGLLPGVPKRPEP